MKYLNKLKYFVLLVLACSLFFLALIYFNRYFRVKKIELITDQHFNLVDESSLVDQNMIFLNKNEIAKKIVNENILVRQAIVDPVWPSTLKVTINLYDPIASLVVNDGYFVLSDDGRILAKKKNNQLLLPVINYYQKLNSDFFNTGDWVGFNDIDQALFLLNKIEQIGYTPLTIDIGGEDMLVFNLSNGKQFIFSINKDKNFQDYELELIIKQFKIEGKDFKKIDLRFNKPVIQL